MIKSLKGQEEVGEEDDEDNWADVGVGEEEETAAILSALGISPLLCWVKTLITCQTSYKRASTNITVDVFF